MADTTITLYGATGVATVTPRFDFTAGTVKVEVDDVYIKDLTTGVEDSIALTVGQKLEYIASDWDSITRIDINGDKVSGDISGWTLPSTLAYFYVQSTKISYDSSRSGRMRRRGAFTGITDTLAKIDFDDCKLNYNQVDNILADLVTCLATNNQLDLAGDNAAPTIHGLASKAILEQRGWTINIRAGRSIPMFQREPIELWTAAMSGGPAPSNIIYDYSVAIGGAA